MKYKFDKGYLNILLLDSKTKYKCDYLSKDDYILLQTTIKNLMNGNKQRSKRQIPNNLDIINIKLNGLKGQLGIETIENLLYVSDAIIKNSSYIKLPNDSYKQDSEDLVKKVLTFYLNCDEQQFKYLNKFVHSPISQLEIIPNNFINRNRFRSSLQALPFYDLEFVRIKKKNRLYDEASLCHELRHVLDIKTLDMNSLDLNIYSETNSIAMELYYQMKKLNTNPNYKAGIIERMNYLRYLATQINAYMDLLLQMDSSNCLNRNMIEESFDIHTKKDLQNILIDLDSNQGYEEISYFIGILKGIHLCNIALEDIKASLQLQDKICSVMTTNQFIPENTENILGSNFSIGENDIKTYKEFIKKFN